MATVTGWGVACVISICSDELPFCGICTYVDMLQSKGRAALRQKTENPTVTGWEVDPSNDIEAYRTSDFCNYSLP